jgi:hypothetical protein
MLGLVLVFATVILLAGFGLSKIDLLNPATSAATQRQMDEQTRHMKAMNALEEQKTAQDIQLELERQRLRAQNDALLQANRSRALTATLIAALAILVPGLWVVVALAIRAQTRTQPAPRTVAVEHSPWHNDAFREAMIQLARERERLIVQQRILAQRSQDEHPSQDNHRDDVEWSDLDLGEQMPELGGKEN